MAVTLARGETFNPRRRWPWPWCGAGSCAALAGIVALATAASTALAQSGSAPPTTAGAPTQIAAGAGVMRLAQASIDKPKGSRKVAAKVLFGAARDAAPLRARAIGRYNRGCLAGAKALPVDGPAWQAMRLSRNRNWGHPALIAWLERFAISAKRYDGWPGLLVGDLAQPRGGPMLTGHASHQIGLDADIWLRPMPDRRLTRAERERISAVSMLARDKLSVDPNKWSLARARLIKRAASTREVHRIFVHPAIKKELCRTADQLGGSRRWLSKVRPWWGHHYHFHVRLGCPRGSPGCRPQSPVAASDGCGAELTHWFKRLQRAMRPKPKPKRPAKRRRPKPPITLAALPSACRIVLNAGTRPERSGNGRSASR